MPATAPLAGTGLAGTGVVAGGPAGPDAAGLAGRASPLPKISDQCHSTPAASSSAATAHTAMET
jgi:hypothetical protein